MVGAVCLIEKCSRRELSFEEILLDETLVQGDIWILKEALQKTGGINYRLGAKQNYELLIRIAREYTVLQLSGEEWEKYLSEELKREAWISLLTETVSDQNEITLEEGMKTDCYLIGRYKDELLSMKCFDDAVLGIISSGKEMMVQYLEKMLAREKEFYDLYDCTQPILIYRGSEVCYNVLDTFAKSLGHALGELGQCVEYFDMSKQQMNELAGYAGRRFKAVIGMQTYMFSVKWEEGYGKSGFVHDSIDAPKYHFVFDHPVWLREHLKQIPHGTCILTPDGNYAEFVKKYYGHPARFLPPAGNEMFCGNGERDYDVVFLGGYGNDLAEKLWAIRRENKNRAYFLNRYILRMQKELSQTPERAFQKTLEFYGIVYTKKQFTDMFYEERWVISHLADYYRNKVIETLLNAGISLHVFGDSWKRNHMWEKKGIIWHEAAIGKDALEVYARAKISLNIMTWHKDGFTERIANAMLQKSVVVTDRTTYLEKNFVSGEDLLMFDLRNLEELPERIIALLHDEERRKRIAENGYKKAVQHHTWDNRARKILGWIEEDCNG